MWLNVYTLMLRGLILFINFMIKTGERIPLSKIEIYEEMTGSPKRAIKISGQKLPHDFFNCGNGHYPSTSLKRSETRNTPATSSFPRKIFKEQISQRENIKTRNCESREEDLIMGVISSARQMRKVFRKHSVELKREAVRFKRI